MKNSTSLGEKGRYSQLNENTSSSPLTSLGNTGYRLLVLQHLLYPEESQGESEVSGDGQSKPIRLWVEEITDTLLAQGVQYYAICSSGHSSAFTDKDIHGRCLPDING